MRAVIVVIATCGVLFAGRASAQQADRSEAKPRTGAEWLARCGNAAKGVDPRGLENMLIGTACLAWVDGFIDRELAAPSQFCIPPRTTVGQVAKQIAAYIEAHSAEAASTPVRVMALAAMKESYACGQQNNGR